jgi:hypothetical protein
MSWREARAGTGVAGARLVANTSWADLGDVGVGSTTGAQQFEFYNDGAAPTGPLAVALWATASPGGLAVTEFAG